jgi:asparagine synthase (glutamine-hydrolysing)
MCGFFGEIATTLTKGNEFKSILDLSKHRGPDQQDTWKDEVCQLGFNRLSILDLSENGKQPLVSPSNKFVLVFNGEVYNYKELQLKYSIKETELRSQSDSEILAHLIEKISIEEFAQELNGMFAITVYDIVNKKVYLIRDFAGIKPLYYGVNKEGLVFASQFDQVFNHSFFKTKKLRPEIMKEFFGLGYMHAPNTVFENIFQVEAGHYITFDFETKKIESEKYYSWKTNEKYNETDDRAVDKFSEIFNETIKNQINADVPLATFLSSGIDSSLVTAYTKKNKADTSAFTFAVDDKKLNEEEVAKQYAAFLKVDHFVEKASKQELLEVIDNHFQYMSEPFGDYSSIPTFLITKKARKYATVMLSGDGGDELFWGYPRFVKSINQAHWFKIPLFLRKIIVPFARKFNKKLSSGLEIFSTFSDWMLSKQIYFNHVEKLINLPFSNEIDEAYKFNGKLSKENILLYLKKNEFDAHMQRTLKKVDLMSMANSLEVRVPFLDKNIIAFSNSIVPKLEIDHHINKIILKKDLSNHIDENLINKTKKGFTVPISDWLQSDLKDDFINVVVNTPFYGVEFINESYLNELIEGFYSGKEHINPWGLWHLYAWQKWAINNKLN